ncbi:hypothetical protein A1O7_05184 [Cladophialophora yegresii CBS 114405]|uniref:Major facilitator superfamily (MFS) profile domain-containing protein n=1 Tax=Cladophialophora yegresii CBS 114405 TaxID=1182544 RepID=W9W921_9EURO|nr:uncharacterized protein A1O7_05184 [Cladophialophora yegresii CBS 114405]EXJ61031.1 hypothetical protein A1O7_05184 [Cladophialophora yegresii CBS 114405]
MSFSQRNPPEHSAGRQYRPYNLIVTALMALGSVSAGYSASIIATTLAQPSFLTYFELLTRPNGTELIATTNGLFFTGGVLGTVTISFFADKWGRKWAIGISSMLSLVASALLAGSVHIGMFIAIRTLAGAGVFMLVAAIPVWISETAPPNIRGILVDFHSIGILFGYALASWIGYAFYHLPPTDNMAWRGPFVVGCGPPFLHLVALWMLPESPRFLLMNGKSDAAEKTLRRLHTANEATAEFMQISAAIEVDKHLESSWISMIRKPAYRKRALLIMAVVLGVESSGVLVINNYGPTIYASLGFDVNTQFVYQIGWITLSLGGGLLSFLIIDRVARPKLLAIGMGSCAACLIILAAIVSRFATSPESLAHPNKSALRAAVGMMYVYILAFQFFLDGTMYAYMGELFPNHLRAKGLVIAIATLTGINILWTQVAPVAFTNIGWKFYLCFIIPTAMFGIALWFFLPDTLGVPLEEVARIFGDHEENYIRPNCGPFQLSTQGKHENPEERVEEILASA